MKEEDAIELVEGSTVIKYDYFVSEDLHEIQRSL